MRPSGRKAFLAAVCALAVMAQAAWADDLYAPAYRGMTGSTTQEWDFVTAGVHDSQLNYYYYDAPDGTSGITNNPFANPQAWAFGPNATWQGGAWTGFTMLRFSIPNSQVPPAGTWKDLRLQVTFLDASPTPPDVYVYHGSTDFSPFSPTVYPLGGGRFQLVQDWQGEPNPMQEFVEISPLSSGFSVDQVVIDTLCAPEPATLAFTGIGLAGLTLRRRSKHGR